MAGNEVLYGPAGGITHPARQDVPTPTRKHQQPGMKSRRPGGGTGLLQPEAIKTASQAAWPVSKYKKKGTPKLTTHQRRSHQLPAKFNHPRRSRRHFTRGVPN